MELEDFCRQNNIVIKCVTDLPCGTHGLCFIHGETDVILINSNYNNQETIKHELVHVIECHLYDDVSDKKELENKVNIIANDYDNYFKKKGVVL